MPEYRIAHIREQGQDMIIVPLDDGFDREPDHVQSATEVQLQRAATSAGLRGSVVLMWEAGGRTHFIGPRPWHPFLRSINLGYVLARCNRVLRW